MKIFKGFSRRKPDNMSDDQAQTPEGSKTLPAGLPVIGKWPVTRQFRVLLVLLAAALLAAALLATLHNREAKQNAVYISTATEMQMLSQR
ncbi:MAG: hypothetical protein OEV84_01220, partial [Betaproteobacteria bacterium]|nr:hypothetical protein [Betaproteobacteria bacterium]